MSRLVGVQSAKGLQVENKEALDKLVILRDLPKARYATRPAVTVYPPKGRSGRPTVFSHLDVYKMVEGVAHTLRENGVRPKTMVATALPNSLQAVVTFYALQWVNAITICVDPTLSTEDISTQLKSVGTSIVISPHVDEEDRAEDVAYQNMEKMAADLSAQSWHVQYTRNEGVLLDTHKKPYGPPAWHGGSSDFTVDPTEVSIYTFSPGSEMPLVLRLTHQNVAASAKAFAKTYGLFDKPEVQQSRSQTVLTVSLSDVQGILLLVTTFYVGGKIVIPPSGEFLPGDLWSFVAADGVSWASMDRSQFLDLFESTRASGSASNKISFVRVCGGGFLDVQHQDEYEEALGCPVLESYGPPEASGIVTSEVFGEDFEGTLGKAVHGCRVAIFATGAVRSLLGPNQEGDIAVCGDNVTSGFLNDEDENAESVIKVTAPGGVEEWFCTGDRGELDEAGRLRLTGSARGIRAAERRKRQEERQREAELAAAEQERLQAEEAARIAALGAASKPTEVAAGEQEFEDGRDRLNRQWDAAARGSTVPRGDSGKPGQVHKPDWLMQEDERQRQIRKLTADDIQNVGSDWCIVTPFLGIPADEDDEDKVVLMRRVPSQGRDVPSEPVNEVDDFDEDDAVLNVESNASEKDRAAEQAAAAAATTAAMVAAGNADEGDAAERSASSQEIRRIRSRNADAAFADGQTKPVKKKVVKFGGVTYEYFYTDEDDEEMLMELLGDFDGAEEKKRTVKLPPKYRGGYYTKDVEDSERIQVRVMTNKEANQFRKSLEEEFAAKLDSEKKRLRDQYEALLAAALHQQEEEFYKNFGTQKETVIQDYNRQFDEAAERQKAEVQQRLLAESQARENIYDELMKHKNDKEAKDAVNHLQQKREDDRAEVLGSILLVKKELEEGVNSSLDADFDAVMVEQESQTPAEEDSSRAEGDQLEELATARSASTVDRLGVPKQPGILTYMDNPEQLEADRPGVDRELLDRMRTIKDEERKLWRSSVVADVDSSAVAVVRGVEDVHLNDNMSYAQMLRVVEDVDTRQKQLEQELLHSNLKDCDKARELAEALTEERDQREVLSKELTTKALDVTSAPVLNRPNLGALEASVLDAAASAEDGRVATVQAGDAARRATELTEMAREAAEHAATAATAAAHASERAADVATKAASRDPALKDRVYREVLPDEVVSSTVKKKSVSVDLRKIDEAMKQHSSVVDARAFTVPSRTFTSEIHAVVQLKNGARTSEPWLKQHAFQTLPLSMAPTKFFYTYNPIPPGRKALAWHKDLKAFGSVSVNGSSAYTYIPPRKIDRSDKAASASTAPPTTAV
mmetsp:Transcript_5750/g.17126  ORF Transcript_5750/g.17126 Transcript_5750/m.17126 type:complete len:1316 (+) Transcript_5750:121-4068(+)